MKQKIHYPVEFTGIRNRKYTLVKIYEHFALYRSEQGWTTCFNLESIRSEIRRNEYDNS